MPMYGPPKPKYGPPSPDTRLMKSAADILESRQAAKASGKFNSYKKKKAASPVNSMKSIGKP
jgi:hypothetical protein